MEDRPTTAVVDNHAASRIQLLDALGLRQQDNPDLDAFARNVAGELSQMVGPGCPPLTGVVNFIGETQHFVGLAVPPVEIEMYGEFPRKMNLDQGFCPQLLQRGGRALQLDDVCSAPRFAAGNPALDGFMVRTYLGAPLTYRNQVFGTVCVIGREPTAWGSGLKAINAIKQHAANAAQKLGIPQG